MPPCEASSSAISARGSRGRCSRCDRRHRGLDPAASGPSGASAPEERIVLENEGWRQTVKSSPAVEVHRHHAHHAVCSTIIAILKTRSAACARPTRHRRRRLSLHDVRLQAGVRSSTTSRLLSVMGQTSRCETDPMPTRPPKEHFDILAPFLTALFNTSLSQCVVPASLTAAYITPMVKN
jgi:hypothetical protein